METIPALCPAAPLPRASSASSYPWCLCLNVSTLLSVSDMSLSLEWLWKIIIINHLEWLWRIIVLLLLLLLFVLLLLRLFKFRICNVIMQQNIFVCVGYSIQEKNPLTQALK